MRDRLYQQAGKGDWWVEGEEGVCMYVCTCVCVCVCVCVYVCRRRTLERMQTNLKDSALEKRKDMYSLTFSVHFRCSVMSNSF